MQPAPINRTLWPFLWKTWKGWPVEGRGCVGGIVVSFLLYAPTLLWLFLKQLLLLAVLLGLIDGMLWLLSVRAEKRRRQQQAEEEEVQRAQLAAEAAEREEQERAEAEREAEAERTKPNREQRLLEAKEQLEAELAEVVLIADEDERDLAEAEVRAVYRDRVRAIRRE
jgi:flagellar biosynthesis component FlhA